MSKVGVGTSESVVIVLRDRHGLVKTVAGRHIPLSLRLQVKLYPILMRLMELAQKTHRRS